MSRTVYLDAYAALVGKGMYSNAGFTPWEQNQAGPSDVRRAQVLSQPYPAFGKLALPDMLAFSAASLLFSHYPACPGEKTGISLGIAFGSLSTDLRYMESVVQGFPSPALFSATLPSSPVSEIAIFYKLKGPNRVAANRNSSGLCALECGFSMLKLGKAETVLVIVLNALESSDWDSPFVDSNSPVMPFTYAFLLTVLKQEDGLNYRCEVSLRLPTGPAADKSDEEYFRELVTALAERERRNITVGINTREYAGSISLAKDV